jgi:hypothetical protein
MADSKLKEFYGDDLKGKIITTEDYELDLFLDVLIYEGKYNDQSPLAYFIKNADLSDWEKEIYTSWLKRSRVTLVEVLRPVDQKSTQLCDLLYKEDIILYDSRLAAQLTPGMVLLGRITPFNEGWIFSGYLPSPIPPDNAKEMQRVKPGDIKQDDILKHVVTSAAELNFQDLKSANPVEEQKR